MLTIQHIKRLLLRSSALPWSVEAEECDTRLGKRILPMHIKSPSRYLVHDEQGLTHSYSDEKDRQVAADVQLMAASKILIDGLLRALMLSCGGDTPGALALANFRLAHGVKESLIESGLVEDDIVFTDLDKD